MFAGLGMGVQQIVLEKVENADRYIHKSECQYLHPVGLNIL